MLREVHIYRGNEIIYWRVFGDTISWEELSPILSSFNHSLNSTNSKIYDGVKNVDNTLKITYSAIKEEKLLFIFVTDISENEKLIKKQMTKLKTEFLELFSTEIIRNSKNISVFESLNPITDLIYKDLRPKLAIVGFSGVGKTTLSKLIMAEEIPKTHDPTMTADIFTVKVGKLFFTLWDFAGQEQFSFLWPKFIKNSNAVMIITDSTLKNIEKSTYFIKLAKEHVPFANICVIANKQDLPDVLTEEEIEKILKVKTYGMIALDPDNREKIINIISNSFGAREELSSLIQPLLERDNLIKNAEIALSRGEYTTAIELFNEIARYSTELGESQVAMEFLNRAKLIESKISVVKNLSTQFDSETVQSVYNDQHSETKKALKMTTQSEIEASEKMIKKINNTFEFGLKLIDFYSICDKMSSKNEIRMFLKELEMLSSIDFPDLKINEAFLNWYNNIEDRNQDNIDERTFIDLQFEILNWLKSLVSYIETNAQMYYDSPYQEEKTSTNIENHKLFLKNEIDKISEQYSKKILVSLMLNHKKSGVNFFNYGFSEFMPDPDLVSGFLSGIESFGKEFSRKNTSMKRLSYENLEIELVNGEYTIAALITSGHPNKKILDKLKDFISNFELQFGEQLRLFSGKVPIFGSPEELIKTFFQIK